MSSATAANRFASFACFGTASQYDLNARSVRFPGIVRLEQSVLNPKTRGRTPAGWEQPSPVCHHALAITALAEGGCKIRYAVPSVGARCCSVPTTVEPCVTGSSLAAV